VAQEISVKAGEIGACGEGSGMAGDTISEFQKERERLNEIVMTYAGLNTKRFYSLDAQVYREGALPARTKELLGLVASFVLRCDDCIKYHLVRCREEGVSSEELEEALAVGLVVGGSITIPHLRRAFEAWSDLEATGGA
jgi:AhpD family alkylhydroperoxidase